MISGPGGFTGPAGSYASDTFVATAVDRDLAVDTLVAGFLADEVTQWLVPDANRRYRTMYQYFRLFVEHGIGNIFVGTVMMDNARNAAALWFNDPNFEVPDYEARMKAATGRYADRFVQLDQAFETAHPSGPDIPRHHYLMLLGVRPETQGQGLGSLLLKTYQHRLHVSGVSAYLVASSERNRRLYLRHGFADQGDVIQLPDRGPRMWPMMWTPEPLPAPPDIHL